MLNDLTPAEQRAKIEDAIRYRQSAKDAFERVPMGFISPDDEALQECDLWGEQFAKWIRENFDQLCDLALAAVPKIEWREIIPNFEWQAEFGEWDIAAYKGKIETDWKWTLDVLGHSITKGTAPTLEAAQAAAEAALLKLVRGGE